MSQDKRHDSELFGASLKLEWQMSEALFLKSLTGYRNLDRFHSWDSDGPGNFIEGSLGTDSEVMSQEFSLGMEGENSYWVNGVFFVREELRQENDIDIFRDFRAIPELAFIPAQFFYHNRIDNESAALYSQLDYELSQDLTLTAGLRYTRESTDYHAVSDLDTVAFQLPGFWDLDGSLSDDDLSGKLAMNYRLTRQASVYGSYSRGYKSGGYNGGYSSSPEQAMDSEYGAERLDAYEIGAKLSLWEQSARLNLAAFYYDYQDQQAFVNITTGFNPYHVLKNVGDSKIYGFEAELRLAPASDWQWDLNLGHIPHAKLGEYRQGNIVVSDNRLPFTSEWTAHLARISGVEFRPADNAFDAMQNLDTFARVSAELRTCAGALAKVASDLILLSSGPNGGIAELELPTRRASTPSSSRPSAPVSRKWRSCASPTRASSPARRGSATACRRSRPGSSRSPTCSS